MSMKGRFLFASTNFLNKNKILGFRNVTDNSREKRNFKGEEATDR